MKILKLILATVVVLVLAVAADMFWRHQGGEETVAATGDAPQQGGQAPQAMPVPTAGVVKKTIPLFLDYSARTEAVKSVALQAKVGGFVVEQLFPDGSDVKAGDLLYRLDPRDYQAALDQTKAAVARDEAAAEYAKATAERSTSLVKSGSLAKDTFDERESTRRQSESALAVSRAAEQAAELNLSYTEIRAPFDGRLGRNQAPVGTLIAASGGTLNTLVQLSPIYVTFNPSERDLGEIAAARAAGTVSVEVSLPGDGKTTYAGELTFIDNAIDPQTGTITARATIENADLSLLPGQYVRARLKVKDEPDVLMVPQAAVGSSQLGKFVYVVGKDGTVQRKDIQLGTAEGELVAATGVEESDQIITGNLQKIGVGMPVQPLPASVASK
ncbi:efflux RND transporter periplasmic adaptor subunit [Mangrovibrevibacter kandeliae]|uniref:efflux RND transporter periplasmic adaptor subunit n=1 Tax=Mangrovibrevibacter kandeliae TaxID=2968473 RepID=UPI002117F517|nr:MULTISPECIES: efflux RND transporter periplasmic adaptor subunit [unclassified Aurantimonas]MCQ8783365.1 efflux RND transporter periplasmic adaptor subunit [Aurantimonas sp. CSK15Z-1]MCW4116120.1 efflux RND transporter periplasmic adaptor subunit [Aurantimonas sp. MSK8Z-1]